MASYKGLRRDGSAVNCKLVCFAIFTAPSHCWLTVTLWPNCTRKDLIFVLFPGDSSQLIAEIPVFTPCRHYTISPYHISHVMFYYALIMTSHVVIRHSSVSTGSAPKCHLPGSPTGRSLYSAKGEGLLFPEEVHEQHPSIQLTVSIKHLIVPHLACALLYLYYFANPHPLQLSEQFPMCHYAKSFTECQRDQIYRVILIKRILILSKIRDQVSLAQSAHAVSSDLFFCVI